MSIGGYLFCVAIQSWIRSVICGSYMARILVMTDNKEYARLVNLVWTGSVSTILLVLSVTAFCPYPVGASCDHPDVSWHWLTIVWIDTIQSVLMIICAVSMYIIRKTREQMEARFSADTTQDSVRRSVNQMLSVSDQDVRFRAQIKIMTAFYALCTLSDWLTYVLSTYE